MRIRNFIVLFLFTGIIATSFYACTPKPAATTAENVTYYRSLLFSETPWDVENGFPCPDC